MDFFNSSKDSKYSFFIRFSGFVLLFLFFCDMTFFVFGLLMTKIHVRSIYSIYANWIPLKNIKIQRFVVTSTKKSSRGAAKKRRSAAKARKSRVEFRRVLSRYATTSEKRKLLDAAHKDRLDADEARRVASKRRMDVAVRKKVRN
jgi:hypothetical protein